jgi:hypothetical protein
MFTVSSGFIGNFKLVENINYNLSVLALLYHHYDREDGDRKRLLNKPIIVLLVSIIEAVLHDYHTRIRAFTREGVANLAQSVIDYIGAKQIDELEKYIASARKHNLFGKDPDFYEILDELRRLRNRVHIQNTKEDFEPSDRHAFSDRRKTAAEVALEKTLKIMAAKYPRTDNPHNVADFNLPWSEYYRYGVTTEP